MRSIWWVAITNVFKDTSQNYLRNCGIIFFLFNYRTSCAEFNFYLDSGSSSYCSWLVQMSNYDYSMVDLLRKCYIFGMISYAPEIGIFKLKKNLIFFLKEKDSRHSKMRKIRQSIRAGGFRKMTAFRSLGLLGPPHKMSLFTISFSYFSLMMNDDQFT